MINRSRNDNVSGRVPMSVGVSVDPELADGAVELAALVRGRRWTEARALFERLERQSAAG